MLDVGRHPNIQLRAYCEIETVQGRGDGFRVTIRKKARYVDETKCTGCGACKVKCPVAVPDSFNIKLGTRKAIYGYFAQGIPSTYTIDPANCRQLNGKKCGICKKRCQADAIDFNQQERTLRLKVDAIVVATGFEVFNPSGIPEYRYRDLPNVVTAIEFERLLSASGPTGGHLARPSELALESEIKVLKQKRNRLKKVLDRYERQSGETSADVLLKCERNASTENGDLKRWAEKYAAYLEVVESLEAMEGRAQRFTPARRLAFVQCVGSRDLRFNPFCSGFCCMHSIKEAIVAHEHEPETASTIFGMDIRAVGKGFEEYKIRGENQSNITYVRGRVAEINDGPLNNPVVTYEDTIERIVKSETFDMVILATAGNSSKGSRKLAQDLGIDIDAFGFFKTDSLYPFDTTRPGIFVCGCACGPTDIPESVAQASSAAARAVQYLTAGAGPTQRKLREAS